MHRVVLIAFPVLVVIVHGIVWEQFSDPTGWQTLLWSAIFSALPMVAIWIFGRRRQDLMDDPARGAAVRSAAAIVFVYTFLLWLCGIMMMWPGLRFNLAPAWLALVITEPIYVYPLLLVLEKSALLRPVREPR
jgi:hypothetical protein